MKSSNIRLLKILRSKQEENPSYSIDADEISNLLNIPFSHLQRELDYLVEKGLISSREIQIGTRVFNKFRVTANGIDLIDDSLTIMVDDNSEKSTTNKYVNLTIEFDNELSSPRNSVNLHWTSDVLGRRNGEFISPYTSIDQALVTRALNVLQYSNYPNPLTVAQNKVFTFTDDEQVRLESLGLFSEGRVAKDAPRIVGRQLYNALMFDKINAQALSTVRDFATAVDRPLNINLHFPQNAVELVALPWELLWDDGATPLIFSRGHTASFTRHIDLSQALPPVKSRNRSLRILAIIPHAGVPYEIREEERSARLAALGSLVTNEIITVDELSPVTRQLLVNTLQQELLPDIIHYYGHGRYKDGVGSLALDGPNGKRNWTEVRAFAALLGGARLVILQACSSGTVRGVGQSGLLTGMAPALIAAGVPLVLGMQLSIRVDAATRLTSIIYQAVSEGHSIQSAVTRARQALFVEEEDGMSWFVPVFYTRTRESGAIYLL